MLQELARGHHLIFIHGTLPLTYICVILRLSDGHARPSPPF